MSGLTIGTLTLSPTFDPSVTAYTATTSNASNKITATSSDDNAVITVSVNGSAVENEAQASWNTGENTVVVKVTVEGSGERSYTVTVTKE